MKRLIALASLILCLTWIASCAGPQGCECGGTCEGCAAAEAADCDCGGTCETCVAAADAIACEGCVALQAGQTGWCADCGTGYFEGQEVNCQGECGANPGGPPCADCVKQ